MTPNQRANAVLTLANVATILGVGYALDPLHWPGWVATLLAMLAGLTVYLGGAALWARRRRREDRARLAECWTRYKGCVRLYLAVDDAIIKAAVAGDHDRCRTLIDARLTAAGRLATDAEHRIDRLLSVPHDEPATAR